MTTVDLNTLKDEIIADGKVDDGEVTKLREVMLADGVIDRHEADVIFAINDAVSGNDNCPNWSEFFVQAITDHVLSDATSPGVIDQDEAEYLITKVVGDGKVDPLERILLANIKAKATSIHATLTTKLEFLGI